MHATSMSALIFGGTILLVSFTATFVDAQAQGPCPNGEVSITDATRAQAKAAGIPDTSPCWNPNSQYAGQDIGESKQFLRSILCPPDGDNYGGKGPDGTIEGLDGKFSVCAAKFLKAAQSAGINVCVREGARSVEKQNQYVARGVIACKRGAACEHPRGIAIDVNVRPNTNGCAGYRTLHQSASQFGVVFYLGCRDAYHFVPMKGGDCSGGGVIQPETDYDFPQYSAPQSPTSGIANQFRQAFGMQPQQPSIPTSNATPAPSPTTSQLPLPTQSQFCMPEYKCSGNTLLYQNSFCATQVSQMCSAGCRNGACIAATSTENTNTNNATSTIDIIGELGGVSATATSVGTSTPLQLILGLSQNQASTTGQGTSRTMALLATGSVASLQLVGAQQTFTSPNLNEVGRPLPTAQNSSTLFALLETMKKVLLWALQYLEPFKVSRERDGAIDGHTVE